MAKQAEKDGRDGSLSGSPIREELRRPGKVYVAKAGEEITVERFSLDQVFDLMDMLSDESEEGLGDALDALTGNFSAADYREIARLSEEAVALYEESETKEGPEAEKLIARADELSQEARDRQEEVTAKAFSPKAIVKVIAKVRRPVYRLLSLALGESEEWIGKNLALEEMMDALLLVVKQEFTTSFFGRIRAFGTLWSETKAGMADDLAPTTATPGSGSSSARSARSSRPSPTPKN